MQLICVCLNDCEKNGYRCFCYICWSEWILLYVFVYEENLKTESILSERDKILIAILQFNDFRYSFKHLFVFEARVKDSYDKYIVVEEVDYEKENM